MLNIPIFVGMFKSGTFMLGIIAGAKGFQLCLGWIGIGIWRRED